MNKDEARKKADVLRGVIENAQNELDELERLYEEAKRTHGEHSRKACDAYKEYRSLYNKCLKLKEEYDNLKGEADGSIMTDEDIEALADMIARGSSSNSSSSDEEDEDLNELANMY
jgi:hypothetical protein